MTTTNRTPPDRLMQALEAIDNLARQDLIKIQSDGQMAALMAHDEIERAPINGKSPAFYRRFGPLRDAYLQALVEIYRLCFRLALAHRRETGPDPNEWAQAQLQIALAAVVDWIRHWYVLTCEGAPSVDGPALPSPETWRAPAWLFGVSLAFFGIGRLKSERVPKTDTQEKLGASHTRLLLKGARRVFLWELAAAIERVRNEETAAAGAIPAPTISEQPRESDGQKGSKPRPKGFEGLGPKNADLSRYMDNLTDKQQMAISLKLEYGLGPSEIASRMGIDRKTVAEHLEAAARRIDQAVSHGKRKTRRAKNAPE